MPDTFLAQLRLGPVSLTVTSLDRSVGFYQDAIGLRQHSRDGDVAARALVRLANTRTYIEGAGFAHDGALTLDPWGNALRLVAA